MSAAWLPPAMRSEVLDEFLAGVDEQTRALEAGIDQLWDDLFIESCADWAVPLIGALVGLPADAERAEVASAIALRRRKGTPAALEEFAEVVSGFSARVIEGWQVTAWAQRPAHPPPPRVSSLDLRERFRVGTPFDASRHSVTPSGPYAPRAATAVVWPWRVLSYLACQAAPRPEARRFALHPLGAEAPLYVKPGAGRDERGAPVRATYRVLQALGPITYGTNWRVPDDHPLAGELLTLTANGVPVPWSALRFGALPPGAAAPGPPAAGQVVVDIARGHIELGSSFAGPVRASWHRPAPALLGALASDGDADPAAQTVVVVNPALPGAAHTLAEAFAHDPAEIRLETSDRLAAPPPASLTACRIVAPRGMTPTITGTLSLDGTRVALEGFSLAGDLVLGSHLESVTLRHLTMAAGSTLQVEPGAWGLALSARRCLLGAIRADLGAFPIDLADCIVDGRGAALRVCGGAPGGSTREAVARRTAHDPALTAAGVTFSGAVRLEAASAENCLFADGIEVVQQQEGCLRHCYLAPGSTPPATYRCGPFPAPTFASIGFEAAGYYSLELEPDHPLLSAASDGGEVGAYHHLRRAARLERLRRRIHEFVPLGVRPGLVLAPWEE